MPKSRLGRRLRRRNSTYFQTDIRMQRGMARRATRKREGEAITVCGVGSPSGQGFYTCFQYDTAIRGGNGRLLAEIE